MPIFRAPVLPALGVAPAKAGAPYALPPDGLDLHSEYDPAKRAVLIGIRPQFDEALRHGTGCAESSAAGQISRMACRSLPFEDFSTAHLYYPSAAHFIYLLSSIRA